MTSVPCSGPRSGSPAAADQRDARRRQLRELATRATGIWKIAPIEARTALGPNGSAVLGAERDRGGAEGQRAAQHVPTLPGSRTPHSATHSGPVDGAPALLEDAERARARAQARDAVEQLGLDVDAGAQLVDAGQPACAAAASRSSPSATKRRSRRRWSRRTSLSFGLWGLVITLGR